jgi:bacterioferritin-associated ferredoxin
MAMAMVCLCRGVSERKGETQLETIRQIGVENCLARQLHS